MMSILGYCIPRWIKMQKRFIFPYFFLPQNSPKRGVNRHFQVTCTKYSNFCTIKMTEVIPTIFCTVIKTTKYFLRVVPKFATQIQNGGRPPSWKGINCYISATVKLIWNWTSGSAMAEGTRDALVSRNSATYKTSHLKTRVSGLSCGIICRRTDRGTDRHTTTACTALSIASRDKNRL